MNKMASAIQSALGEPRLGMYYAHGCANDKIEDA